MGKKQKKIEIENYYNTKLAKIGKILDLDNQSKYKFLITEDNNGIPLLEICNKSDDKIMLSGKFQTIGVYNMSSMLWYWSWNIPFINKQEYNKLTKIRDYPKFLEDNFPEFNSKEVEELYFYTDRDSFYCTQEIISLILKLSLYITEGIWFFPIEKKIEGNIIVQYIMLTNANKIG